jgi:hypothetical protein
MALTNDQKALADVMSEISEYCWFASWLIGTEYRLWHFMTNPDDVEEWGNYPIPAEQREQLRALSTSIGGWIVWRESDEGETFLSFAEWQPVYDAWRKGLDEARRLPRRYVDYPEWFAKQQQSDEQKDGD